MFSFDFGIFSKPLPYLATTEIHFGDEASTDTWTLYFVDVNTSKKPSWTKANLGSKKNHVAIEFLNQQGDKLTLDCTLERL